MKKEIENAIVKGEIERIEELVKKALEKRSAGDILEEMIAGMRIVGDKFEKKEYFVPETLLSAHAMQKGMEILKPYLKIEKAKAKGKVIIGTVEGDIHDIGKNLVSMFLEGAGFEVHDLGRDVATEIFIEKAKEIKPDIVGLSALLSTSIEKMREIIEEFSENGLRDNLKIVVGGAALSEDIAFEIGADAYAEDANKAVKICERLLEEMKRNKAIIR